jgi:hypothetical protein
VSRCVTRSQRRCLSLKRLNSSRHIWSDHFCGVSNDFLTLHGVGDTLRLSRRSSDFRPQMLQVRPHLLRRHHQQRLRHRLLGAGERVQASPAPCVHLVPRRVEWLRRQRRHDIGLCVHSGGCGSSGFRLGKLPAALVRASIEHGETHARFSIAQRSAPAYCAPSWRVVGWRTCAIGIDSWMAASIDFPFSPKLIRLTLPSCGSPSSMMLPRPASRPRTR